MDLHALADARQLRAGLEDGGDGEVIQSVAGLSRVGIELQRGERRAVLDVGIDEVVDLGLRRESGSSSSSLVLRADDVRVELFGLLQRCSSKLLRRWRWVERGDGEGFEVGRNGAFGWGGHDVHGGCCWCAWRRKGC